MIQTVSILGVTGSIGQSTLKILQQHPEQYHLYAASAYSRMAELVEVIRQFSPQVVVVPHHQVDRLNTLLKQAHLSVPEILTDEAGLIAISSAHEVDVVMAAIVGAAGLLPTLAAVKAGKRVLLANKESLVMSGDIMMQAARDSGALLLPVDSEHNAIFQCLPADYLQLEPSQGQPQKGVSQILLTASGGPFRCFTAAELKQVTPEQACKHPNWSMGQKISVDSATLMNKGLELIEACHLFGLAEHFVTVVVHPQSIIHSMVQYVDGSTLAQLGNPDMCTPIAHALAWPTRLSTHVPALDVFAHAQLDFEQPDTEKFPCLNLARQAFRAGGTMPTILNAANEIAVAAFLQGQIGFTQIPQVVEETMQACVLTSADTLEQILQADHDARVVARQYLVN